MFGIGLPEMILILALALIVVGPDKLPDLARSLAKGMLELKKTAEGLKESFSEEGNPLDEIRPELEDAAKSLKDNILEDPTFDRDKTLSANEITPAADSAADAYKELLSQTTNMSIDEPAIDGADDAQQSSLETIEIETEAAPGNKETNTPTGKR